MELGIRLEYIPPYSPNLNLIEHAWKFVKGEFRTKYDDDFTVFCKRIDSIIADTCSLYKCQMDVLADLEGRRLLIGIGGEYLALAVEVL